MSKKIQLTQGQFALVDDADFDWLANNKWCCSRGYAVRRGKGKILFMHRMIANTPDTCETDHINGNKLDNRRCNLRVCTKSQNNQNRKSYRGSVSQYKGVHWNKLLNKWRTQIVLDKKKIHIGVFANEIDAAKAYDKKAKELFGQFAKTNFIEVI